MSNEPTNMLGVMAGAVSGVAALLLAWIKLRPKIMGIQTKATTSEAEDLRKGWRQVLTMYDQQVKDLRNELKEWRDHGDKLSKDLAELHKIRATLEARLASQEGNMNRIENLEGALRSVRRENHYFRNRIMQLKGLLTAAKVPFEDTDPPMASTS